MAYRVAQTCPPGTGPGGDDPSLQDGTGRRTDSLHRSTPRARS